MNYEESINFITSKENFYIDLGLGRILSVLSQFGNPQDELDCIHVAGTNGKGSVCAMLEAVLREAGYKTGLYTSPHIWEYTERIKVNGSEIPKEKFAYYASEIGKCGIHLTEFEILTVIMFLYFRDEKVDVVLLETGLGGRLDATNVIKRNLCAIITQIDLDHTERLGNTKEKIAYEKAGIIKNGCPVITRMDYEVIKDKAKNENSKFILASSNVNPKFIQALSLKGKQQAENLALVIATLDYIFRDIDSNVIIKGLQGVEHPCRFQYIESENIIIDACHNPNGVKALRENLDLYYPDIQRRFVFGCLRTKDYAQMMGILFQKSDEIFLNEFNYPNACTYKELEFSCPFPAKKYTGLNNLKSDKLNIICGSFYMISSMHIGKKQL